MEHFHPIRKHGGLKETIIIKINGNPYHTRYINTKSQVKALQSLRISYCCEDNIEGKQDGTISDSLCFAGCGSVFDNGSCFWSETMQSTSSD